MIRVVAIVKFNLPRRVEYSAFYLFFRSGCDVKIQVMAGVSFSER